MSWQHEVLSDQIEKSQDKTLAYGSPELKMPFKLIPFSLHRYIDN